ncbi:MAG: histidine phosphatase family protein [Paracoccaceae bacterium]|nr:histidine phosphatase family protein [Paracoccaceae bacterium]
MSPIDPRDLVLVRHAPAETGGRLCGRRDVSARLDDADALARLAGALAPCARVVASPARSYHQTAEALSPGRVADADPRLWEQDFGEHEGLEPAALPDLGPLDLVALARHAPPGGESFADMVARAAPALTDLAESAGGSGPVAVVAHAGTVRAGLALALGCVPAALAFEVAPLSLTRLRLAGGGWSVGLVNGRV